MTNFALFKEAEITIPSGNREEESLHDELVGIYRSYASLYPNPSLIDERRQHDTMSRAIDAASVATRANPRKKKRGLLSSLFGASEKDEVEDITPSLESNVHFVDEQMENDLDDGLCGTSASLDLSCIPQEAHSMARFHISSSKMFAGRPNVAKREWTKPGASTVVITGLGELIEFKLSGEPSTMHQFTADRDDLLGYNEEMGNPFRIEYAKAAMIGPNFLIVSWGMPDGHVVFYRKRAGLEKEAWWPMATFSPSNEIMEEIGELLLDDTGSPLLRITGLVPIVIENNETPAASLAISRLGGTVEVIPLDPRMWYGPELENLRKRKRRKKGQSPPEHYSHGKIPDIAHGKYRVLAFKTIEYHSDIIGLHSFRTMVSEKTVWDQERYPTSPPAQFVLVAHGMRDECETVSFWGVSALFANLPSTTDDVGFSLHVELIEVIDVELGGCHSTVFVDRDIMKYWRKKRSVEIRQDKDSETLCQERVTSISVQLPITTMSFNVQHHETLMVLHDSNGGTKILDITLLEQMACNSLSDEKWKSIDDGNKMGNIVPLVSSIYGRSQVTAKMAKNGHVVGTGYPSSYWVNDENLGKILVLEIVSPPSIGFFRSSDLSEIASYSLPGASVSFSILACLSRTEDCHVITKAKTAVESYTFELLSVARRNPIDLVQALYRLDLHEKAVEAAEDLLPTQQVALSSILDQSRLRCWQMTGDSSFLAEQKHPSIIHEYALNVNISEFSVSSYKEFLASSIKTTGQCSSEETNDRIQILRDRYVRAGTYEILCSYQDRVPSSEVFASAFLDIPLVDLAIEFAEKQDWKSLSVLYYRHYREIVPRVYDYLPLSGELQDVLWLYPAVSNDGTSYFSIGDSFLPLRDLPEHLKRYNMEVLSVEDDATLIADTYGPAFDSLRGLFDWYAGRIDCILSLCGDLDLAISICGLAISAASLSGYSEIDRFYRIGNEMRWMKASFSSCNKLSVHELKWIGIFPSEISSMQPVDAIGILVDSSCGVDVLDTYRYLAGNTISMHRILSACLDYLEVFGSNRTGQPSSRLGVNQLCSLLKIASSLALEICGDIEQEADLVDYVKEIVHGGIRTASSFDSLDLSESGLVMESMWSLFECLPLRVSSSITDKLKQTLSVLDILCSWPSVNPFEKSELVHSLLPNPSSDKVVLLTDEMAEDFCNQLRLARKLAKDTAAELHLLSLLVSDLMLIPSIVGDPLATTRLLSRSLVPTLLASGEIFLLKHLLHDYSSLIDTGALSEVLSQHMERTTSDAPPGPGALDAIVECRELLRSFIPASDSESPLAAKYAEAVGFINQVIVPESGLDPISVDDIRDKPTCDFLRDILVSSPSVITCGCEEWDDPVYAKDTNDAIRQGRYDGSLPGHSLLRLAHLLGHTDNSVLEGIKLASASILISDGRHGAGMAIMRTLVNERRSKSLTPSLVCLLLCLIHSQTYDDDGSKKEIASILLFNNLDDSQSFDCGKYVDALAFLRGLDYANFLGGYQTTFATSSFLECLCRDVGRSLNIDLLSIIIQCNHWMDSFGEESNFVSAGPAALEWCLEQAKGITLGSGPFSVDDFCFVVEFSISILSLRRNDAERLRKALSSFHRPQNAQHGDAPHGVMNDLITRLIGRGYSRSGATRSVIMSGAKNFKEALDWAVSHSLDSDFDSPWIETSDSLCGAAYSKKLGELYDILSKAFVAVERCEHESPASERRTETSSVLEAFDGSHLQFRPKEAAIAAVTDEDGWDDFDMDDPVTNENSQSNISHSELSQTSVEFKGQFAQEVTGTSDVQDDMEFSNEQESNEFESPVTPNLTPEEGWDDGIDISDSILSDSLDENGWDDGIDISIKSDTPSGLVEGRTTTVSAPTVPLEKLASQEAVTIAARVADPEMVSQEENGGWDDDLDLSAGAEVPEEEQPVSSKENGPSADEITDSLCGLEDGNVTSVSEKDSNVASNLGPSVVEAEQSANVQGLPTLVLEPERPVTDESNNTHSIDDACRSAEKERSSGLDISSVLKPKPKVERVLMSTFSTSPDRSALKDQGKSVFESSRSSAVPMADERRRLIEEGRRLLQQARAASVGSTKSFGNASARSARPPSPPGAKADSDIV